MESLLEQQEEGEGQSFDDPPPPPIDCSAPLLKREPPIRSFFPLPPPPPSPDNGITGERKARRIHSLLREQLFRVCKYSRAFNKLQTSCCCANFFALDPCGFVEGGGGGGMEEDLLISRIVPFFNSPNRLSGKESTVCERRFSS